MLLNTKYTEEYNTKFTSLGLLKLLTNLGNRELDAINGKYFVESYSNDKT